MHANVNCFDTVEQQLDSINLAQKLHQDVQFELFQYRIKFSPDQLKIVWENEAKISFHWPCNPQSRWRPLKVIWNVRSQWCPQAWQVWKTLVEKFAHIVQHWIFCHIRWVALWMNNTDDIATRSICFSNGSKTPKVWRESRKEKGFPQAYFQLFWQLSRIQNRVTVDAAWQRLPISVREGVDPNVTVVLLEDMAAVLGVGVAGVCMALTQYYASSIPDALGSCIIGGILGTVASFVIYTNTSALVGKWVLSFSDYEALLTVRWTPNV